MIISPLIIILLSCRPSFTLQCYENEEQFIDSSDAVTCDSSYNACRIRFKIGQNYWRRNCETADANELGCSSFLESNPTVNVTICKCDTDLCNEYANLAALGLGISTTDIPETSNTPQTGTSHNSDTTEGSPTTFPTTPAPTTTTTESGPLTCYDSDSNPVDSDDVKNCGPERNACFFSVNHGQNEWRRYCTFWYACGTQSNGGPECVTSIRGSDDNPYNRTSCCCQTNNCNLYAELGMKGYNDSTTTAPSKDGNETTTSPKTPLSSGSALLIRMVVVITLMVGIATI